MIIPKIKIKILYIAKLKNNDAELCTNIKKFEDDLI